MLKHIFLALIISIIAIIAIKELHMITHYLVELHQKLNNELAKVIYGNYFLEILRAALALFLIPFFLSLIPYFIYYAFTKRKFPYYAEVFWTFWLLLAGGLI